MLHFVRQRFPKSERSPFLEGPQNKGYGIFGSYLGPPVWKPPFSGAGGVLEVGANIFQGCIEVMKDSLGLRVYKVYQ